MGAFMALGRHSQMIIVIPKLDIVATMTGILRDDEFYPIARLVDDISRSAKSDTPLPAIPSPKICLPLRYALRRRKNLPPWVQRPSLPRKFGQGVQIHRQQRACT